MRGRQVLLDEDLADLYGVETAAIVLSIFKALHRLISPPQPPKRPFGFRLRDQMTENIEEVIAEIADRPLSGDEFIAALDRLSAASSEV